MNKFAISNLIKIKKSNKLVTKLAKENAPLGIQAVHLF
jgi:hypothetical protein